MRIALRTAALVFIALSSTSCGDDKRSAGSPTDEGGSTPIDSMPRKKTGYLLGGRPVSHVPYVTSTLSGITDTDGAFEYLDGESVRFTLGKTILGTVLGADEVTPFTLQDATPPRSYSDFYAAIFGYGSSPAVRALNLTVLFAMLDADGDLDNGIDLTGWDVALADLTLDVSVEIWNFRARTLAPLQSLFGSNTLTIPLSGIISHLYASLAISLPAVAPTTITFTNADGAASYTTSITYDTAGRVTHTSLGDGNGAFGSAWEYDARGHLVEFTSTSSASSYTSTSTYDARGALLTRLTAGSIDTYAYNDAKQLASFTKDLAGSVTSTRYSYDSSSRTVPSSVHDGEASSPPSRTQTDTFDEHARVVTSAIDDNADGTVDRTQVATFSYDQVGRMLSDGQESYTFDSKGRALTYTDAHLERPSQLTFTYDLSERPVTAVSGDGHTTTLTYDQAGNIQTVAYDGDVNKYAYNADGNLASIAKPNGAVESYAYASVPNGIGFMFLYFFDGTCSQCFW